MGPVPLRGRLGGGGGKEGSWGVDVGSTGHMGEGQSSSDLLADVLVCWRG